MSCQLDDLFKVVGLICRLMRRPAALQRAAFRASMGYYIAASGIRLGVYRFHFSPAGAGAVAGVFVNVKRPKAEGAVIAGGISERLDPPAAVSADKAAVVF